MYIADIVLHTLHDRDPHPAMFDRLLSALRALGSGNHTPIEAPARCDFRVSFATRALVHAACVRRQRDRNWHRWSAAGMANTFAVVMVVAALGLEGGRR